MSQEFDDYIQASRQLNQRVERKQLPIAVTGAGFEVSTTTYQRVPPLISLVASTGQRITSDEIKAWNDPLWKRLGGLKAAGITTNYPCVYFYSCNDQSQFILQIGFPVPAVPQPLPPDLIERRDPARWCASAVLVGDFMAHIGQAWKAATDDVARRGLQRSGEDREIYHHMTNFICTEVQIGLLETPDLPQRIQ
jgi:hypothetical protein